jgi:hypothetical protein
MATHSADHPKVFCIIVSSVVKFENTCPAQTPRAKCV